MPGVADYLVERLRAAGVRMIFGLPGGGGNLDLIEAAGRAGLPFVLTTTETGSAIAALAQAEITGAPGACLTTLGPGAASVVNGVACAKLDRAPLLVITDSYATNAADFSHQRLDHRGLLAPIIKWSGSLTPGFGIENIDRAFARLAELPPGPVHLDCPADFETGLDSGSMGAMSWDRIEGLDAPEFQDLLASARKPLLIAGLGARAEADATAIRELCETRRVPALVTYKAKGVVPDGHDWCGGVFTHGAIERPIVDESDLLIGVGFDPVEILPRPWIYRQPIVSVAPWEMADQHVPFRFQHVGDVAESVHQLAGLLKDSRWDKGAVSDLRESARTAVRGAGSDNAARNLTSQDAVIVAAGRLAGRARITVDAGAHMFPATMLWPVDEPSGMLISNGLSTMGFALPAAIGAALLERDRASGTVRPVVALTGDGGLLICLGELATAARERLKIIVIVFNDASLSLIEIKQQARRLAPAGVALGDLNWPRMAEGFGMPAWTANRGPELEHAIDQALAVDGPCLIEARIDRSNYGEIAKTVRGRV